MRVAILETVKTSGGFEQEFDRLIIEELRREGHEPVLYLPEHSTLPVDFGIPIEYLSGGEIVDYEGAGKLKKLYLSLQRERRRVRWFDAACERAARGEVDCILLTTATYRYLRSLRKSRLRQSPVPVVFIFLGVNPHEMPKFLRQAEALRPFGNIRLKVTTLRHDFTREKAPNVDEVAPPVLLPAGVTPVRQLVYREPVRIGFFGHYRKGEKDVAGILRAFAACRLQGKAELLVQAAPTRSEDAADLERIMADFADTPGITFLPKKYYGRDWYDLLMSVDALFLPYEDRRYLYNWSAVYFNALALYKPVLATPVLNPEILAHYEVGLEVDTGNLSRLQAQLRQFVQGYAQRLPVYERELARANRDFSVEAFVKRLLA